MRLVGSRWLSGSRCGFPQLFGSESEPSFRVGSGFGEQVGGRVVRFASCRRTGTPKQWKPIAGQVSVSRPDREAAGRVCGSPLDRGTMASWKKVHRGRRNPQKNWGDLEYALTRALRHGEYGMRGQLQADGWAPIRLVADRVGVSVEDVRRSVEWQSRGPKVRLESLGDWVRALQGHSSDSGLRPHDFTSKVSLPGSTRLLHGTFKERVAGIAEKGLLAGGTGRVGEGRLFVHWSANAEGVEGNKAGVRGGADVAVLSTIDDLRNAGCSLRQGKDGVILSSDVPAKAFESVRVYYHDSGGLGATLWTPDVGFAEAEPLPTGDSYDTTSSSSEGEAESTPRPEGRATGPEQASSSGVVRDSQGKEVIAPAAPDDGKEVKEESPVDPDFEEVKEESPVDPGFEEVKEESPVGPDFEEVKTEEEPPRAGPAPSRPGRGEESGEPNRQRGEMSKEELQEIWSSSRRTWAQRAMENTLAGVAVDELTHQFGRSPALSRLVEKQKRIAPQKEVSWS